MDDWLSISLLSLAMLVGCFLAGYVPLTFNLSESKLKLLTIFGAGLLVGTALAVIIPEGIATLYQDHHESSEGHKVEISDSIVKTRQLNAEADDGHHVHHEENHNAHKVIGVTLVVGFVFMLLIDQVGGGHSHGGSTDPEIPSASHSRNKFTATLGLCVHAAADGIALGAASSTSQAGLTLIVFIAIMLHKTPAAFGLVSFLLHDGMSVARIRKHLFAFSAAAPLGAIITFAILNRQSKELLTEYNATGIAMLFSAGTFLYVATVHILPEVSSTKTRTVASDGSVIIREHKGFTKTELLALILGSFIPVGITLGHNHSH